MNLITVSLILLTAYVTPNLRGMDVYIAMGNYLDGPVQETCDKDLDAFM